LPRVCPVVVEIRMLRMDDDDALEGEGSGEQAVF